MNLKNNYNLTSDLIKNIITTILEHKTVEKIILFGSRANRVCKPSSDIDIAIVDRNWSSKDINLVKNMLEETLKTSLTFDLLNFYALKKETLKENILKFGKVIYDTRKD